MSREGLFQASLFTLVAISAVYFCNAAESTAESRSMVESPLLKEMEYKKSLLYNRKPGTPYPMRVAENGKKGLNPTGKLPSRRAPLKPSNNAPVRQSNHVVARPFVPASSAGGGGNTSKTEASSAAVVVEARNSTGNNITETAASDRIFIPPYKMPFWGMPYGVYSNGGFINPGLFPFVPGGPGFPPYDGIFGSPFGPGGFPGNQSPFPKGTGTPMDTGPLPMPPIPYGQPYLNPTGRRSNGSPRGAFSPGSQMGYYYHRRPTSKPPPKKKKPKKPKPEPEPESDADSGEGGGGCSCSKGKGHDSDDHSHKRPKSTTPSTTSNPCPCTASSSRPSYKKEVKDEEEHYHHHHHHDHSDDNKYRSETSPAPCPLSTSATTTTEYAPPTPSTSTTTTTEYAPPPPSTTAYEHHAETTPTTEYASSTTLETTSYRSRKPCKLRHRPPPPPPTTSQRTVYYDYDSTEPSQMPPPTRKPCPLKLRGQKPYEKNDYAPATHSPIQPYAAPQPTPVTIYQAAPTMQTQQYQPYQYQQPQYISASSPQVSQPSHSTILYKPAPQEIVHTPTSVTVPLPFPYVMDHNGMFQHHPTQNSQQVTYKMDLNQDLLTKISTPVVVTHPQQQAQQLVQPIQQHQQYQTVHQLPSSESHPQYVLDGHTQSQPQMASSQPRIYILDTSTSSAPTHQVSHQPSVNFPSSSLQHASSSTPSVVVLKSDSLYDFRQQRRQQPQVYAATPPSPVTVSYANPPSTSSSDISSYSYEAIPSTSDYSILLTDSANNRGGGSHHKIRNSVPLPYRTVSSYQVEQPARRIQHAIVKHDDDSNRGNNNYVIIDRAELEELKKSFYPSEDNRHSLTLERNKPPPPDLVHIQYHSKLDDDKDDVNKPLTFHSENRARQFHQQEQPKLKTLLVDSGSDDELVAESSSPFSRIFKLNNDDISSAGKRVSIDRDKSSNHAPIFRTSLVFDKYAKNESELMK